MPCSDISCWDMDGHPPTSPVCFIIFARIKQFLSMLWCLWGCRACRRWYDQLLRSHGLNLIFLWAPLLDPVATAPFSTSCNLKCASCRVCSCRVNALFFQWLSSLIIQIFYDWFLGCAFPSFLLVSIKTMLCLKKHCSLWPL